MAEMTPLTVGTRDAAVRISVKVKPRASKTRVQGVEGGVLVLAIAAPPVDGEANAEVQDALAKWLGVKRRDVTIVSGETARTKILEIAGISAASLGERLGVDVA